MKVVVGTNSLTEVQYPAYTNHCQFWFRLGRSYPTTEFIFSNPARMSIDRMRNMSAKVALESEADYLLFLDDDVLVPPNHGLQMLLDCDADIAAGRVCVRGWPFDYMSFQQVNGNLTIDKELPEHGILERDAVGFSFALIKTSLLKRIKEPWFVTGLHHTEDIYFCIKTKQIDPKCSIKINCDLQCGHILWPEVIHEQNRTHYIKYFREINQISDEIERNPDRGREYLDQIKEQHAKTELRVRAKQA